MAVAESRIVGIITPGANTITNSAVSTDTDIDADKLEHLYKAGTNFNTAIGDTPASREEIVFVASTAGVVRAFHCMLNDTGTTTDIDFEVKKNGSSLLSSAVNITHSNSDRQILDGTLSETSFVTDDVISISMSVTTSTAATGAFAWVELQETAPA